MLDPQLLEILVCPKCKGDLEYRAEQNELVCHACRLVYEVRDDIPIMLIEEAETVDDAEHERLMAKAAELGLEPGSEPQA